MKIGDKIVYEKNADKTLNRIIIPKFFIDKYGRRFYMEVYEDYIKLIPMKEEKDNG
jgi:hypothetical protein